MLSVSAAVLCSLILACGGMRSHGERRSNPDTVVGKTWQWESTRTKSETITSPIPGQYTILLGDGGKVGVRFDCNRGGGNYRISGGQLTFGPLVTTRMTCAPGSLADRFAKDLGGVRSFYVDSGDLYLEIPGGATMRFSAAS